MHILLAYDDTAMQDHLRALSFALTRDGSSFARMPRIETDLR